MSMTAHEKLRFWRQARGMTQTELAQRIGTTQSVIVFLENGGLPLHDARRTAIAPILQIPPEALTDEAPDPLEAALASLEEVPRVL
jgi:transcriptional regulator with XRE-family HTH domain